MSSHEYQLHTILIGDSPLAWAEAGFTVDDDRVRIGMTTLHLVGGKQRGINAVGISGLAGQIDGLNCDAASVDARPGTHPNHVDGIDHLVVVSPAIDRTTATLAAAGIEARRQRAFSMEGKARRQCFFWLGDVILELIGSDDVEATGPARFWGLALSCEDLDAAAAQLGARLGQPVPAVQRGRSIATMCTREHGISVPLALMTPHHQQR